MIDYILALIIEVKLIKINYNANKIITTLWSDFPRIGTLSSITYSEIS